MQILCPFQLLLARKRVELLKLVTHGSMACVCLCVLMCAGRPGGAARMVYLTIRLYTRQKETYGALTSGGS